MRASRGNPRDDDLCETLAARIEELELRLKLMEARLRNVTAGHREGPQKDEPKHARPRPRCPGCLLELPRGKKGDRCVWCGFYFEAVKGRAAK